MASYCVGLTGGVASGKSAVTRLFEALGVVVADADVAARNVVAKGSAGLAAVVAAFGESTLDASGALDRASMRLRVFQDPEARRRLEAIIHPLVREHLQAQCAAAPGPYAIAAVPLLAESGGTIGYPWLQRILVIDVPVQVQHARLVQRDGIDDALASLMIEAQASRPARLAIADDVLVNDGPIDALPAHVAALDRRYRALTGALDAGSARP